MSYQQSISLVSTVIQNAIVEQRHLGGNAVNSTCPVPASIVVQPDFIISSVSLIPTCILALIIGLWTSKQIRAKTNFDSKWIYNIAFFLFACMMTDAMFVHCFIQPTSQSLFGLLLLVIDLGLTSSIATTFMWAGLADIELIDPRHWTSKLCVYGSFVVLFAAWIYSILHGGFQVGFLILYLGVVGISCAVYLITQGILLHHAHSTSGISSFIIAGISGAVGLGSLQLYGNAICTAIGPALAAYFGPDFIWFILSDVSVYYVYDYVIQTQELRKCTTITAPTVTADEDLREYDIVIQYDE
jgi:hypothetical protein